MRALVVYESMFGNTQQVAEAVAEGLRDHLDVEVVEVTAAPARVPDTVELLVVGAPTHAFGLSRARTRQDAGQRGGRAEAAEGTGVREWLDGLEVDPARVVAATFDTHIAKPKLPGAASRAAAKQLRRRKLRLTVDPESFFVADTDGPLLPDERDRARSWGATLATTLVGTRRA